MIRVDHLNKYYINGEMKLHALKDLSFHIEEGEFVAIMGSSGSGKSTMMNILGCLDKNSEGTYILDGIDVSKIKDEELCKIRNVKIGFVFQSFNLLSKLTALENVELPLIYAGIGKKEREEKAKKVLKKVGLEDRMHHKPNELSGGQKQRVAIARALVNDPAIILADEPTGNLDEETSETIFDILRDINKNRKQTIIVVTHSKDLAKISDKKLYLKKGILHLTDD